MAPSKLNKLLKKRRYVKDNLDRFEAFLAEVESDSKKNLTIPDRLNRFENILEEYNIVQSEIEDIQNDEPGVFEENSSDRAEFEDIYYNLLAKAKALLPKSIDYDVRSERSVGSSHNPSKNVRLPKISLPKFSGEANCWSSFYDRFKSLIHDDPMLSISEKFFYLQSALSGEAASLIEDLETTDINYDIAFSLLKERFEDKKGLIRNHIQYILDIPSLSKENFSGLRNLLDSLQKNLRALKQLGEPVGEWDTLLLFLIVNKLDKITKREWETVTNKIQSPTMEAFIDFLKQRCDILKGIDDQSSSVSYKITNTKGKVQSHSSTENYHKSCLFCNSSQHRVYHCEKFLELKICDRINYIKRKKACTNCLQKGHMSPSCKSFSCRICNKKHNILLHLKESDKIKKTENNLVSENAADTGAVSETLEVAQSNTLSLTSAITIPNSFVFLSTAVVDILDNKNRAVRCRALLDSGSQSSFITCELAKRLQLPSQRVNISVVGTNAINAARISKSVSATIQSVNSNFRANIPFFVIKNITENVPQYTFSSNQINIPNNLILADPKFYVSEKIDILLGCNIFYDLLLKEKLKLGKGLPTLQESLLGWIVSGPCEIEQDSTLCCTSLIKSDIQAQLERFWTIEEVSPSGSISHENNACESHFVETHYRELNGRFGVRLPFFEDVKVLGDSREIAIKRFFNIEKKLNANVGLRVEYSKFINEYLNLGHMSLIKEGELTENYYLPHHCVHKADSLTTKVRVVFDGSCKTSSGKSLNDILMIGPKIQDDIFNILLRFRENSIAFTADIEKMYRQINVHPNDRKYQRIVWRDHPDQNLNHFELNTVTYGLAPSSFLATRCLRQLALESEGDYPRASQIIGKDFYMDDLISGSDTIENAAQLICEIISILNSAHFPLRQWVSNKPEIFEGMNIKSESSQFLVKESNNSKTLGILWYSKEDVFGYSLRIKQFNGFTKRIVLSIIAQIFDPLGLISPIIVTSKILLQKLWSLHIDWDEPLPKDYTDMFLKFYDNIIKINELKIPRLLVLPEYKIIELHCFSDASMAAYGSCVYLLSKDNQGNVLSRLACSKSRVTPLKPMTLPRLELSGALLSAQLYAKIIESLNVTVNKTVFWCDSTIVLGWIKHDPSQLKTFVSNRVVQIRDITKNCSWRYVPTKSNPADLVSRGVEPSKLLESSIWWEGPEFLANEDKWPTFPSSLESLPEIKPIINCVTLNEFNNFHILEKYSTYPKLLKIFAYILRFAFNCRKPLNERSLGALTKSELESSKVFLIKMAQYRAFRSELDKLKHNKSISSDSKILSLSPFLDDNGILRVGGRMSNSQLKYDQKHPIILASNCSFTNLIIRYEHERNFHAGVQLVLTNLRNQFWPIKGRQNVKKIIRQCVRCFRAQPVCLNQKMSDLPSARVMPYRAFHTVGIDYAGPYLIKDSKMRNKKYIKAYICLFVCFSSKAIHIELISDLTANGFLNGLKRFISRRGLCQHIYSDNASYFKKAEKELRSFAKFAEDKYFQDYLNFKGITWHFIPPLSPHMGGLWERNIRSVKYHLKRIMNETYLTFEEFYTLLTQIECILNSRPLVPLTEDPEDLEALTPGHLLIGTSLQALPEFSVPDDSKITVSRYKHLKMMLQHFWNRWSGEYLHSLQQRTKWRQAKDNFIKVGDLVILKESNVPPMKWKLGRVIDVHPGNDGLIRVVSLKTLNGTTKRAIHKICVLPVSN